MCCARMYCSATPFNGEIYAAGKQNQLSTSFSYAAHIHVNYSNVGGVDESNCLNSIEKYDPKSGLWAPFSSLPRMMCGSGMQVLDSVPLSLALPSRKRKALYVDAGLVTSEPITGPLGIVPGVDALHLEADDLYDDYYDDTEPRIIEGDYFASN